jgi:SsrA-binding protein
MLELMNSNKVITVNRKAYHDYTILESIEAGLVLTGTEIKSIREGRVTIADAYAKPEKTSLWLYNSHIAAYQPGSRNNHELDRPRKLLLHKRQLADLNAAANQKGLTQVPLRLYIRREWPKN